MNHIMCESCFIKRSSSDFNPCESCILHYQKVVSSKRENKMEFTDPNFKLPASCCSCVHKDLCKYQEQYTKITNKFADFIDNMPESANFVTYGYPKCRYHNQSQAFRAFETKE